jgi:TRAP transporter TAXI family solute receptor
MTRASRLGATASSGPRRARGPRLAVGLLVLGGMVSACAREAAEPRRRITIATGGTGGVYYPLGAALAQALTKRVPGVTGFAEATVASVFNVQAIQRGSADIAFTQGDVAYFAYKRGTEAYPTPHTHLRGLAVLYVNHVQIVARQDGAIRRVADFRGRHIGVGAAGSGTEVAARIIIEGYGLRYDDVRVDYLAFDEVTARMRNRTLDAGFMVASYPVSAITDAARTVGIQLIPVGRDAVNRIRADYPFFKPVVLPKGTYRGQHEDVETVGVDNLLVCREDLPEDLVYSLTKAFFEALPELAAAHVAAALIVPDESAATPIPLHPGAARYYRERELFQ